MKILVHLVSGQNLPNYIASKIIKPDYELFAYTEDSKNQLNVLQKVLTNNLVPLTIPAWDFVTIKAKFEDVLKQYSNDEVILNFTAGNKIMSQAAFKVFEQNKKDCIYINSQDDEYIYFNHSDDRNAVRKSKILITATIEDYIKLNGQTFVTEKNELTEIQKTLINFLKNNFKTFSARILLAGSRYDKRSDYNFSVSEGKLKGTLIMFRNHRSILKFCINDEERFSVEEEGRDLIELCFGKWFEHICFNAIKRLNYFDEMIINCHIQKLSYQAQDKFADKNELDILALRGIYPSIFECKSGGIKSEHVEKLAALKQTYLGRYASLFFVTYFPLSNTDEFHILLKEKMKDNKIILLTYNQLKSEIISQLRKKENLR